MTTKRLPEVPAGMERIYRRFDRWRGSHRGRLPIPEALWASAAPVKRTAAPTAGFLELVAPQAVGLTECLIELEGPRGKVRIQWKGAVAPDLAGLSPALWESA